MAELLNLHSPITLCYNSTVTKGKHFKLSDFYEILCIGLKQMATNNFKKFAKISSWVFEKGEEKGTKNECYEKNKRYDS